MRSHSHLYRRGVTRTFIGAVALAAATTATAQSEPPDAELKRRVVIVQGGWGNANYGDDGAAESPRDDGTDYVAIDALGAGPRGIQDAPEPADVCFYMRKRRIVKRQPVMVEDQGCGTGELHVDTVSGTARVTATIRNATGGTVRIDATATPRVDRNPVSVSSAIVCSPAIMGYCRVDSVGANRRGVARGAVESAAIGTLAFEEAAARTWDAHAGDPQAPGPRYR